MYELNKIYCEEASQFLANLDSESVNMIVTSPPYDSARRYTGFYFPFQDIAKELYRVIVHGGIAAWVVGDQTVKGCESLTSFEQALYFKSLGFSVETMIFEKKNPLPSDTRYRYIQAFEYIFILSKGQPKTFNPIKIRSKDRKYPVRYKQDDFITTIDKENKTKIGKEFRIKYNIWSYSTTGSNMTKDKIKHPAMFPEALAEDLIKSWSNEGDLIVDPMCGSGTTCKVAHLLNRKFLGCDISSEYCEMASSRLEKL